MTGKAENYTISREVTLESRTCYIMINILEIRFAEIKLWEAGPLPRDQVHADHGSTQMIVSGDANVSILSSTGKS